MVHRVSRVSAVQSDQLVHLARSDNPVLVARVEILDSRDSPGQREQPEELERQDLVVRMGNRDSKELSEQLDNRATREKLDHRVRLDQWVPRDCKDHRVLLGRRV